MSGFFRKYSISYRFRRNSCFNEEEHEERQQGYIVRRGFLGRFTRSFNRTTEASGKVPILTECMFPFETN